MGNKIATEEDYWMCSGGIMPAQMQSVQLKILQKDDKKYLMKTDTSTASFGDFTCKWVMLIMALIAAVVVVAIVATGGAALAVIVAAGAIAGAGGAIYGSVLGSAICGQKAAIARIWLGEKSNLTIAGQQALTTGSVMQCPVFGSKIVHAPNVKNWWDALRVGIGNFGETVILGALGGALIGVGGAILCDSAALALPTLASVGTNIVGSVTGWGMAARVYFGANALSNKQALGEVDMSNVKQRDAAFGDAAFPEYGSIKRIASGQPEPMDALLLLYFLNLRVPGSRGGTSPKEETGTSKNEETNPKNEEVKPIENTKPVEEKPAEGKDGKAYEEGKNIDALILQRKQLAYDFYKNTNPTMTDADIASHLMGIDFTKPVEIISVPPGGTGPKGNELYQYTKVNTEGETLSGKYYTDKPGNTPSELGVSERYNVRDKTWQQTDEIKTVKQEKVTFDKPVEGLKSTSKPINDTWSLKNESIPTDGTGSQIYIPKK
ncbi:hypothetical protein H7F33_10690 [Pedobacter sp. PAMC26386]|nr:hypothetical protein H7F33_10690 [Pedobacter sp. PAMC26386]